MSQIIVDCLPGYTLVPGTTTCVADAQPVPTMDPIAVAVLIIAIGVAARHWLTGRD